MNTAIRMAILSAAIGLVACQKEVKNVALVPVDDTQMYVCVENQITEHKPTPISDLVEGIQIINFENSSEALFKAEWIYFSDNYICVKQGGGVAKLFDKSGKFIANVGNLGNGPGEYRTVYDIVIDEPNNKIYIAQIVGQSILTYNLKGEFVAAIELAHKLNKPKLSLQPNGVLSLVQLCFEDLGDQFTAANIHTQQSDSVQYLFTKQLALNMQVGGVNQGFDNEIWSYRNTTDFPFMMTSADTLYHYNSPRNRFEAKFTLVAEPKTKSDCFFIFNELPRHYLVFIVGENGKTILVDKEQMQAYETTIVNDFLAGMELFPKFQDGYFYCNDEAVLFKEKVEKHLDSGSCSAVDAEKLRKLVLSIDNEQNNVLLIGKLKI